ncbi:ECF transporter S component [Leuconostoc pseudomesenteroides]|uniref:ECF transporter S component n=1 Tax=Leuconostoc pseudomesenteroides TaxID=33968 RepID=UPI0039EA10F6
MSTKKTKFLVVTTFFMAIVLVQMIVPWLGMLPLGAFVVGASATIIQFTVAIAAIILGPKYGAFIGGFWGVLSFINALTHPGTIGSLMFQNPLTAIVPRLLVGLLVGYLFNALFRNRRVGTKVFGLGLLGAVAAIINTTGVVLLTTVGFTVMHTNFTGIPTHGILPWLVGIVSFNAIFEIIVGFIEVGLVAGILLLIAEKADIKG